MKLRVLRTFCFLLSIAAHQFPNFAVAQCTPTSSPQFIISRPIENVFDFNNNINAIASADLNGDGFDDLVVQRMLGLEVLILLSNGDGTFQSPVSIGTSPYNGQNFAAGEIRIADINHDGKLDIVVGYSLGFFLGHGDGTFSPPIYYSTTLDHFDIVDDYNGDGLSDFAGTINSTAFVIFQNSTGSTDNSHVAYQALPNFTSFMRSGKFNGDNLSDFIAINQNPVSVTSYITSATGAFAPMTTFALPSYGQDSLLTDLDGDGKLDIVVATSSTSSQVSNAQVVTSKGNGNGTFQTPRSYSLFANPYPYRIYSGDFNCDGRPDLVFPHSSSLELVLNSGDGTLQAPISLSSQAGAFYQAAIGDFNGDHKPDIAAVLIGNTYDVQIVLSQTLPQGSPIGISDPNPSADTAALVPVSSEIYNSARSPESTIDFSPSAILREPNVTGAAADGVTRLMVRWPVPGPGSTNFTLTDETGRAVDVGSINRLGQAPTQPSVTNIQSVQFGPAWYAFAYYKAPSDFDRRASDYNRFSRPVTLTATFTGSGGVSVQSARKINLIRPPILFVHGLWSSAASWDLPMQYDPRFITYALDYSTTNEAHFQNNLYKVRQGAQKARRNAQNRGYAATLITAVGHSMGGILARLHIANRNYDYFRNDNLGQGDFYKLITVYTPHFGSPLACFIQKVRASWPAELYNQLFSSASCLNCGAVDDLRPDSSEIQNLPAVTIPTHTIAGIGGVTVVNSISNTAAIFCPKHFTDFCKLVNGVVALASGIYASSGMTQHDLIVSQTSALGGLTGSPAQTVPYQSNGSNPPIGIHIGPGEETYISNTVLLPLIFNKVTSPSFAPGLSRNTNVPSAPICGPAPLTPPAPATNGAVYIVPMSQTVVQAGGNLNISAFPVGAFNPQFVSVTSPFGTMKISNFNSTLNVRVPPEALGNYELTAVAVDSTNHYSISTPLSIQVITSSPLQSIQALPSWIGLGCRGEEEQLIVSGFYQDGVVRTITQGSLGTRYVNSNNAVVSVSSDGKVTALRPGVSTITVSNGTFSSTVDVKVADAWCDNNKKRLNWASQATLTSINSERY